jgi:uncharacterized membrane protein YgdD (TMEM256/DUF423 family)|tara:strand:- start:60 stop:428 length:369 start_codon:yes stop_codon:yes gene_type:complete
MKKIRIAGTVFALFSVVLGAFASHFLKTLLTETSLHSFETGTRYMMYHGLALLLVSVMNMEDKKWIFRFFFWGTILFSFSIFFLSFQSVIKVDLSWIGPITPIGGTSLIFGWFFLLIKLIKA